ncbi:phosphoribosylamine--glycine ligase [Candidatus Pacearchaeota archaeon CG10_big_fil_rev_8_21_14_0_10_32_14]|nr:MAG: phosphoribosylamine--glycine ligase [Candidatus Pacearchaeota archaeon CG10_big_fil_rev_8_21_14_0_10_32_14]
MSKAKILIVGSGGREHALGWKLSQSDEVSEIIYSPGNGGTEEDKGRNISLDGTKKENFPTLLNFVETEGIDMVVVGPEAPLTNGIVDYFNYNGYDRIFGPTQNASQLESDKFFSFDLMQETGIPQADGVKCYSTDEAIRAINRRTTKRGIVIKARGLTEGKGVTVCNSREEALIELKKHSEKYGPEVLIAQRLFGQEFSAFGISDGNKVSPLEISLQDHKLQFDGDKGLNTGGMGAYGPVPVASAEVVRYVADYIMTPIIQRMKNLGEYKGFLYAGMMMTKNGVKVIEFNIRFGDPECQPAMMMLKSDLYESLSLSLEGKLDQVKMEFNPGASCCVVLASPGYPESYQKGRPITGLEDASSIEGIKVFHAGTKKENGQIVNSGGRVLGVTSYSPLGIRDAQIKAYEGASYLRLGNESFHYRRDIANKALK